ncbi:zf-TFIIB domain-containing protein [Ruicaihuangia caeni]|uniref:Zf-TFIIB domain-containing protein n=1 Tax=Ruicaihuangia caeni TaxID=3042517 RepID=A0AAW6T6Y1_9MICO|nr:zf-TFIIB domain-containing protein [Klugiella sp. YN-L-19]MDI2099547.1 zf-TFIIB domain-containing protein [Klugiella sp. YN-L-19]
MQCPVDQSTLVMSERNGIEIDYCPQCRGVWLDRGELDKIIDRAGAFSQASAPSRDTPPAAPHQQRYREEPRYDERRDDSGRYPYRKKKENWLSDLFD